MSLSPDLFQKPGMRELYSALDRQHARPALIPGEVRALIETSFPDHPELHGPARNFAEAALKAARTGAKGDSQQATQAMVDLLTSSENQMFEVCSFVTDMSALAVEASRLPASRGR